MLVDAGDSWFNAVKLHLPGGCAFEIQACYASIGWSMGAALGYGLGAPGRRVVQIVGDGAVQMTAQVPACCCRCCCCCCHGSTCPVSLQPAVNPAAAAASAAAAALLLLLLWQCKAGASVECCRKQQVSRFCPPCPAPPRSAVQELSTIMRYRVNPVIVLINNG